MHNVHSARLIALRLLYAVIALGIVVNEWPEIVSPAHSLDHMNSIVRSVLGAVSILAFAGVFRPLALLPLLIFELAWKTIWLVFYGRSLWASGQLTEGTRGTLVTCLVSVVLVLAVVPWGYIWRRLRTPEGAGIQPLGASNPMPTTDRNEAL